jgi:hypothetical protein
MLADKPIPRSLFEHAPSHPLRASEKAVSELLYWLGSFSEEQLGASGSEQGLRIRQLAWRTRRQGQPDFRADLLQHYERKCAITGYAVDITLEAAHIEPYVDPLSNALDNGLLLRADVHALFDEHLIGIDASNHVVLSSRLSQSGYADELKGATLFVPKSASARPSNKKLAEHLSRLI